MSMPTSGMSFMGGGGAGGSGGSMGGGLKFFSPSSNIHSQGPNAAYYREQAQNPFLLPSQRMRIQGNVSPMQLRAQLMAEEKARQKKEGILGQAQGEQEGAPEIQFTMGGNSRR